MVIEAMVGLLVGIAYVLFVVGMFYHLADE